MNVSLKPLIGKLNTTTRNALEAAAGLCVSRTHYDVEVEHYLTKLLDSTGADLDHIMRRFGVDRARLADDLSRGLRLVLQEQEVILRSALAARSTPRRWP